MIIAVETTKHPERQGEYRVWYLELNHNKDVIAVNVTSKDQLVKSIMRDVQRTGKSSWRAFLKGESQSKPVELIDFIGQSRFENTHFGNLPHLSEFQNLLDQLKLGLEIRAIA
jgi:hypothetical protein